MEVSRAENSTLCVELILPTGAVFSAYSEDYEQAGGFPVDQYLTEGASFKLMDEVGNESVSRM